MRVHRFARLADLTDPDALAALVGPVRAVTRSSRTTVGYTAAHHEHLEVMLRTGERRRLLIKRIQLTTDWTARRTGDQRGREAALLEEPALEPVWEAAACPYLAFAAEGEASALHARFWASPALDLPWLARASHHVGLLDPRCAKDRDALALALPAAVSNRVSTSAARASRFPWRR